MDREELSTSADGQQGEGRTLLLGSKHVTCAPALVTLLEESHVPAPQSTKNRATYRRESDHEIRRKTDQIKRKCSQILQRCNSTCNEFIPKKSLPEIDSNSGAARFGARTGEQRRTQNCKHKIAKIKIRDLVHSAQRR